MNCWNCKNDLSEMIAIVLGYIASEHQKSEGISARCPKCCEVNIFDFDEGILRQATTEEAALHRRFDIANKRRKAARHAAKLN